MFEATKKFCDSFLNLGLPGFDLAVYKNGECILRHMNGYSNLESKVKIIGRERYNIYSCSKVITCTAAMQLWEKGYFSLDDKLSDYMPEFSHMRIVADNGIEKATKPILIKHLFEMTAGFSYNVGTPEFIKCKEQTNGRCPTRDVMNYLAKEPLLFEPGDRWQYSLCHDVLAALVEVISGVKFEQYIKKNIFDAVGMNNSTFMLPVNKLDTIAEQYRYSDGKAVNVGKEIQSFKLGSEYVSGGAGAISTVDDYMKFLEGLRTHKLLKPETVKLMMTDRLTDNQKRTYPPKDRHGYGLGGRTPGVHKKYLDFGWGGAAGSYLAIDMQNQICIFFAAHMLSSPVQALRSALYRIVRAELMDSDDLDDIFKELNIVHDYNLTY